MSNGNGGGDGMTERNSDMRHIEYKRRSNDTIAPMIKKHLSASKYKLFLNCGKRLDMLENETRNRRKLARGFFCHERFCAGCAWRQSIKTAQELLAIAQEMEFRGKVPIFVTLTVPNVPGDKFRSTILELQDGWKCLLARKEFHVWRDYILKSEVTYSPKHQNFHPHLHGLVFVPKKYFRGQSYISHDKLLEAWREVMGQPEITQVRLQRCRDKEKAQADGTVKKSNAILELSKYMAKASDYAENGELVFDTMYEGLKKIRSLIYGGECKELSRMYRFGKLAPAGVTDDVEYVYWVTYVWQKVAGGEKPSDAEWKYVERMVRQYEPDDGVNDSELAALCQSDKLRRQKAEEDDARERLKEASKERLDAYRKAVVEAERRTNEVRQQVQRKIESWFENEAQEGEQLVLPQF